MNKLVFILIVLFFPIEVLSQQTPAKKIKIENNDNVDEFLFVPDKKLLNGDFWTRVSPLRFESSFLRLAVEWKNNEYQLLEMDGNKRVLARSKDYHYISKSIINLTSAKKIKIESNDNVDEFSFVPDKKLLNSSLWTRVSPYRFESTGLRFAVEWKNNEYQLLEMSGNKRVIAYSKDYYYISKSIIMMTLRSVDPEALPCSSKSGKCTRPIK